MKIRCSFVLASALALGLPAAARAEAGFYCEALGVYENCNDQNGYEQCREAQSNGAGAAVQRPDAEFQAISMCTNHMTQMVIIGNYPTGGSWRQWARNKRSCVVTGCREVKDAPASQGGGDVDSLLRAGDERFRSGDRAGAIEMYAKAEKADPRRLEPYLRLGYAHMVGGEYSTGCDAVDRGLRAAPADESMRLVHGECSIYRRQPAAAVQTGQALLGSSTNADLRLGGAMLVWIGGSLRDGRLGSCAEMIGLLRQRDALPPWDLAPLVNFLGTEGSAAATEIVRVLTSGGTDMAGIVRTLESNCGSR